MEELSRQFVEMMRLQQTQTLELQRQNMERQKENDERQLQLMKFVEEKQSKMQKELNKQRRRKKRKRRGKKGIQRKNTGNADAGRGKIGTTNSIANKDSKELNQNVFSQTAIWSALETFHYVPEEDLTFEA